MFFRSTVSGTSLPCNLLVLALASLPNARRAANANWSVGEGASTRQTPVQGPYRGGGLYAF
jgi:hypothetical protein